MNFGDLHISIILIDLCPFPKGFAQQNNAKSRITLPGDEKTHTSDQQTAKAFYLEQLGQAEDEKMLKGRIVLQYDNGQKVVVISKDGQGSQIDILVKSAG